MIELRMVNRDKKTVLQMRQIPLQIGWSKSDDCIIQPRPPVSLVAEKNWSPWEDVPFVENEETVAPPTRMVRLEDALRRAWDYARGNVTQPPKELWEEVEALLKGVPDRRK